MKKKKQKQSFRGPISTILYLTAIIAILSLIMSLIGFQGNKTYIGSDSLETSMSVVKNVISLDGLKFIIGNAVTNFINFKPLAIIIIVLTGIGICEKSGLLSAMFYKLKNVKFEIVIFFTLFLGIVSSIIGEYSYMLLIPFIGLMYKYLNRNSMLGIIIVFIGITMGYGTGLIFNYDDILLGNLTQAAAVLDVDASYTYDLLSNIYIMVVSTLCLSFFGTIIINRFLVSKYPKKQVTENEILYTSKKGIIFVDITFVILLLVVIYMILDIKLLGTGILLDHNGNNYITKLFGDNSPFKEGIVIIITFIMMVCGFVYGKISGNIKNSHEYSLGLSKNFENLGFMFVIMFFTSQMIAILDWTNIGEVISVKLVDFISSVSLSGLPLIIIFIFIVIIMSFLIPDTITKWKLLSPTVVPLFMRSNITPDFTQFLFKISDSVGKMFTPFFIYFLIALAFLEKYKTDEKKQISVFGTMKAIMPTVLILTLFWILFIVIWYVIGLPIGVGTYSTI